MPVAHLNETDLFYVEVGKGLPCLVMHGGLGGDHSALHPWLDPLGDVLRLVYYDHRGNGRSGRPSSDTITFEQLCADADALREHLGFEEVAVLGYSFGGLSRLSTPCATPSVSATSSCSTQRPPSTTRKRSRPTLAAKGQPKSSWRR
jgi:pimeloyl-ACP methyl ester carboxylesterase